MALDNQPPYSTPNLDDAPDEVRTHDPLPTESTGDKQSWIITKMAGQFFVYPQPREGHDGPVDMGSPFNLMKDAMIAMVRMIRESPAESENAETHFQAGFGARA